MKPFGTRPQGGAQYPESEFGTGIRQVAQLIKADVGLEVACLDLGGWDSHVAQPTLVADSTRELGQGLAAFRTDLGDRLSRVTLVAMSEFGRRAYENSGLGTDHGRATAMFLLGGGIRGGRVYRDWPGLAHDQLEDPGDLKVTIDFRDILGEVVQRRLHNANLEQVFPNHPVRVRGVTA